MEFMRENMEEIYHPRLVVNESSGTVTIPFGPLAHIKGSGDALSNARVGWSPSHVGLSYFHTIP